ncbi:MAG: hypothetical protein HRT72_03475 [Flavobacteriales bacterium]|nr:hypothetical protein [Flavobacteriales bacterium]
MLSLQFENPQIMQQVINNCVENKLIIDSFLFNKNCVRIGPPLIITEDQIREVCTIILDAIDKIKD